MEHYEHIVVDILNRFQDLSIDDLEQIEQLKKENEQLKQSIDRMGERIQGLWAYYYGTRWGIWSEAVEDIANDLGFKIHHAYDNPISNSELKKERVEGVKKITQILEENELIKQENKELKEKLEDSEFAHRTEMAHHRVAEKELQERNDRQYKQLGDLYRLIEEKDWRALTDMMDDFKKNEKQLQKEWKCYE